MSIIHPTREMSFRGYLFCLKFGEHIDQKVFGKSHKDSTVYFVIFSVELRFFQALLFMNPEIVY